MSGDIDFETIAAEIHHFYCDLARKEGYRNDFPMPYPELPEYMKEDNRAAARRIGQVLSLAGLRLDPRNGESWTQEEQEEIRQLIEQNIELLAEGEHDAWVEFRLRQGWRIGPCKDIPKRETHLLVPYARFEEQIRRKLRHELGEDRFAAMSEEEVEQKVRDGVVKERNKDRESVRNYVRIIGETDYRIVREAR